MKIFSNLQELYQPPLCKRRWHTVGVTEELFAQTADFEIIQNDSVTIPHPLRGSSLCTREPFKVMCYMGVPFTVGSPSVCANFNILLLTYTLPPKSL